MQMVGTLPMHQTSSSSSFFCAEWAHLGSGPHRPFPDSETLTGKGRLKKKIKSDCNQYKMHTSEILFHSLTRENQGDIAHVSKVSENHTCRQWGSTEGLSCLALHLPFCG